MRSEIEYWFSMKWKEGYEVAFGEYEGEAIVVVNEVVVGSAIERGRVVFDVVGDYDLGEGAQFRYLRVEQSEDGDIDWDVYAVEPDGWSGSDWWWNLVNYALEEGKEVGISDAWEMLKSRIRIVD